VPSGTDGRFPRPAVSSVWQHGELSVVQRACHAEIAILAHAALAIVMMLLCSRNTQHSSSPGGLAQRRQSQRWPISKAGRLRRTTPNSLALSLRHAFAIEQPFYNIA
jgi:hypothetical protein